MYVCVHVLVKFGHPRRYHLRVPGLDRRRWRRRRVSFVIGLSLVRNVGHMFPVNVCKSN